MVSYCPYCLCPVTPGQRCSRCGKDPSGYQAASHHCPTGYPLQDRYLVGRVLGEGGFGITYLGWDTKLERLRAVKEYFPNMFVHREASVSLNVTCYPGKKQEFFEKGRTQFLQEARVMARFDGFPEIVRVLDFFQDNNTAYIVMELLSGSTLRDLLKQQGRIPAKELFEMMEPAIRAMGAIHDAGIIHRDISPDNIMLLDNGQIKLLDFGCARNADNEHTMTVMLKHGYAPVEQYTGHDQGPWTDVYALCATLYHCLTGRTPPRALERFALQDPLDPPNRLGAALTPKQEEALLRGLAVEQKTRWKSMLELYNALYHTDTEVFLQEQRKTEIIPKTGAETNQKAAAEAELAPQTPTQSAQELFRLGLKYAKGDGVPRDDTRAAGLYRQAAERGHKGAQNNLGNCYYNGRGVKKDYAKAAEWYQKAAQQGNIHAQNSFGDCYYHGRGVEKDYAKAVEWYQKAAQQGNALAQKNLGYCYYWGQGVKKDYGKAVEWYQKAAQQGHASAQNNLGICYFNGNGIDKDYTKAVEWFRKAAEQGNVAAQSWMGCCYENGYGMSKDLAQAMVWYQKAAEQKDKFSQYRLGEFYYNGKRGDRDYAKAAEWYQKAAEQGHTAAQEILGDCYYYGHGVTQDYAKAVEWYQKAAQQGHALAQNNLGACYFNGKGAEKDFAKAAMWFQKAAEQGNVTAQGWMGFCYHKGYGVEKNIEKAIAWYQKAADQNDSFAQGELDRLLFK